MLLANLERTSEFPFIAYYTINTTTTDPSTFYSGVRGASLSKFEAKTTRYSVAHTIDLYSEVVSICRPPLHVSKNYGFVFRILRLFFHKKLLPAEQANVKGRTTSTTAFIISVYKVRDLKDIFFFCFIDIIALLFILCRSLKAMTARDLNAIGYIGQVG